MCFTEVPVVSAGLAFGSRAAVIHAGEMEIKLSFGVDAATIRAIIEALRSCHHDLPESITVVCCWAHAQHYFDEAVKSIPKGVTGRVYCKKLFQEEAKLAELPPEERYEKQLELEKPVFTAFHLSS